MIDSGKREVWLRGPVTGIPPLLQPVAHALLQAREELNDLMTDFPDRLLWEKPAGVASPGFHLKHLAGVLNRLFTYAKGQALAEEQLAFLREEESATEIPAGELVYLFNRQVDLALSQLQNTDAETLLETRTVGRARLPSNVLGLLIHAAEHTQRHVGQLIVTVRVVKG